MSKRDKRVIPKKNAEIVVNALKFLRCATVNDIVNYIAASHQVNPQDIRRSVKIILHKGVKYGYVQKRGPIYSIDSFIPIYFSGNKHKKSRKIKSQKKRKRLFRTGPRKKRARYSHIRKLYNETKSNPSASCAETANILIKIKKY